MKKRVGAALLAAVLAATAGASLAGCGKGNNEPQTTPDGRTIIKFFGWGSVEEQNIFQTMIEEFKKENQEYEVVYTSAIADNFISQLLNYSKNPREMPDVFYMPDTNFVQWASTAKIMENLTPYIEASDVFEVDNLWEEAVKAYRYDKDSNTFGTGDIYALPKDIGPNMLAYNKTLVQKKGVTIVHDGISVGYDPSTKTLNDQIPMTWAQFIRFCDDVNEGSLDQTDSIVGVTHYPLETAYASLGGRFTDGANKTATIDNDKFAEALQFVADLSNVHGVMTTAEGQTTQTGFQRFTSGLAATSWVGAWNTPEMWVCNFDWDILHTPVPNEGSLTDVTAAPRSGAKSASYLGSVGLAMYNRSACKEGAYKLIEFLSAGQSAQRLNYQLGMAVPNLVDMAQGEFMTAKLNDPKSESEGWNRPQNRKVYLDMIKNSERRPQAYTYSDDWFNEMWDSGTNEYKLYRVWNKGSSLYGSHVDVWDWSSESRIQNGFLSGLEKQMQNKLDRYKSRYNWA